MIEIIKKTDDYYSINYFKKEYLMKLILDHNFERRKVIIMLNTQEKNKSEIERFQRQSLWRNTGLGYGMERDDRKDLIPPEEKGFVVSSIIDVKIMKLKDEWIEIDHKRISIESVDNKFDNEPLLSEEEKLKMKEKINKLVNKFINLKLDDILIETNPNNPFINF